MPAGGGEKSLPVSAARLARCPGTTPAGLAFLSVLAFLAVLAPATASQAQVSKPLPLQMQQPIYFAPKIATVTPQTCVRAGEGAKLGDKVTLEGSNFGFPKPASYSLAVQPAGGSIKTPVTESSWTATSITFNVPAGLAAGTFTVGILSGGVFVAQAQVTVCAKIQAKNPPAIRLAGERILPESTAKARSSSYRGSVAAIQPSGPGGPPEITSVSPSDCMTVGHTATANGVNLGTDKLAAGFSLGYQANNELPTREIMVMDSDWSPTSIRFIVPPEAGAGGWFALGIIFDSTFYAQQYVAICGAHSGQSGYSGSGGYDYSSGEFQDTGTGSVAGPKGARRLGPGGVDVQIEPSPASGETAQERPQQPGKRAVGGKLLAMKALAGRGLHKVNKECDLYEPHCPCCRKDDSVCLEKESDNEDGTSIWMVSWKPEAKTVDGQEVYAAGNAEDDVEAVTGLQCESVSGGAEGSTGGATLNCR